MLHINIFVNLVFQQDDVSVNYFVFQQDDVSVQYILFFQQDDVSVQLEALDILGDLLSRFGGLLISFHPSIQQSLLPQLASPRLAVRKRSIIAISK